MGAKGLIEAARGSWNMEGRSETDRHGEKDTGSQKEQRGESCGVALWVFLYFQSSILSPLDL